jgi:chromosome segregation ATPase
MFDGASINQKELLELILPEDQDRHPILDQIFNPLTRLGERVAVIEANYSNLKEDTASIRSNIHHSNNKMQELIALERECSMSLDQLVSAQATMAQQVRSLAESVNTLLIAKSKGEGAWFATTRITVFVLSILTGAATVVAGVMWALGHLSIKVSG